VKNPWKNGKLIKITPLQNINAEIMTAPFILIKSIHLMTLKKNFLKKLLINSMLDIFIEIIILTSIGGLSANNI
jgi:hypothetical protein